MTLPNAKYLVPNYLMNSSLPPLESRESQFHFETRKEKSFLVMELDVVSLKTGISKTNLKFPSVVLFYPEDFKYLLAQN